MSPLIVANWKEYGTSEQVKQWVMTMAQEKSIISNVELVVCPPFIFLPIISGLIKNAGLSLAIGAQNVSRFEEGRYTGEVSAKMISEFASYVILGHSERRRDLNETDATVAKKVKLAKEVKLTPIVCVSEMSQAIALRNLLGNFDDIIAYEPLFAIGSGNPDTPENANTMAVKMKEIFPSVRILYGGSVDGTNVKSFVTQANIEGVLVGNRSTNPAFFLEILKHAH